MRVSFRLLPVCLTAALFAAAPPADAQETETQRAAAREVVARMAAVQRSLDVPGLVATLTAPNAARDAVVARAAP
jgi:hypothetical protein